MLMNLQKKTWTHGLTLKDFEDHTSGNAACVKEMQELTKKYDTAVVEEEGVAPEARVVATVGRMDAKKHLEKHVQTLLSANILQTMGTMLDVLVF